ncbi:MAG: hypothetical protein QGG54_15020 [Gammaproteobacteria bacterium]|jgi:hypothetical protein|nr:hypothetical protein [Gammaproteobacteria bacterium]
MSTAATLYILQQIDSRLDRHEQRMSELDVAIGDDSVVRVARAALDNVEAESQAARRAYQIIQEEIDTVDRKRISGEKRLYSGTVTNTKELQDLQDEGVALKRRIVALEDRQLEAMIAQEDAEMAAARTRDEFEKVRTEWMQEQADLSVENEDHVAESARLKDERDAALIGVSAGAKHSYDAARHHRGGVAVALLKDNICTACGMAPSAARIQHARSGSELVKCGNCMRIIYVK